MLIIITGHGHFATGLQSTIELLAGLQAQLKYVDFTSEMSEAELHNELLKNTPQNEPVLFFCDLLGGTPFKQAVTITTETTADNAVVVGCNVGSLLEVSPSLSSYSGTAGDLADRLVELSQQHTSHFQLHNHTNNVDDDQDGI